MPEQDPLSSAFYETSLASVSQGAAGTTSIITGVAGKKIYVTGIILAIDAAGSLKFTEVAGDLSGPIPLAQNGGIVVGNGARAVLWTSTLGEDLKITTVTGKASGWLTYYTA